MELELISLWVMIFLLCKVILHISTGWASWSSPSNTKEESEDIEDGLIEPGNKGGHDRGHSVASLADGVKHNELAHSDAPVDSGFRELLDLVEAALVRGNVTELPQPFALVLEVFVKAITSVILVQVVQIYHDNKKLLQPFPNDLLRGRCAHEREI